MKIWVNGTFDVLHIGHIKLLEYGIPPPSGNSPSNKSLALISANGVVNMPPSTNFNYFNKRTITCTRFNY